MSAKPHDNTSTSLAEHDAGADIFFAPGHGGIAVWVRREELQPRGAIRVRGGPMAQDASRLLGEVLKTDTIKSRRGKE